MKIAILTTGRFHVCDLARELIALGHDVTFYSCVPPWRLESFGVPRKNTRWLAPWVLPALAAKRLLRKTRLKDATNHWFQASVDWVGSKLIEPCDVLIGMSGTTIKAAHAVKAKYHAKVWLERGSRHIESQKQILASMPGAGPASEAVADYSVRRETQGYALADTIVIASLHVERSFIERGIDPAKLFRNPYGVSLDMFPPTPAPADEPPTVITVGQWSLRKGSDVLLQAWRKIADEAKLMHVGSVMDVPLPTDAGFTHQDAVNQKRLVEFYAKAAVFVQASREEGLALVQVQALACGLPIVCTDRTGGEDLKAFIADPDLITVVPHDDPDALAQGIRSAVAGTRGKTGLRDPLGDRRSALSWHEYGLRYDKALRERA